MKIFILASLGFLAYLNLAQCLEEQALISPINTSKHIDTKKNHDQTEVKEKNSKELNRVPLISSVDDHKPFPLLDQIAGEFDSTNQKQPNTTSHCSEQCKNYFDNTDNLAMNLDKLQSCIRGCHYKAINLILVQQNISLGYDSPLSSVRTECSKYCQKVYPNDTEDINICNVGCQLADNIQTEEAKTRPIKTISSVNEIDDQQKSPDSTITSVIHTSTEKSLDDRHEDEKVKRTFSIFIPIPIRSITSQNGMDDHIERQNSDGRLFGSLSGGSSTNSLSRIMMSMVRSMTERARQMMDFVRSQQQQMEESRFSLDTTSGADNTGGEAVSVERSMSVMMTKDKDGHNKMVVMHQPPKIIIHRTWNPFELDFDRLQNEKTNELKQPEQEQEHINRFKFTVPWNLDWARNSENRDDDQSLGRKIFHRLTSFGLNNPNQKLKDDSHVNEDDDMVVINTVDSNKSPWSTCLISMMPLLYLLVVILLLYIIIWLFYSVPNYVLCKTRRRQTNQQAATNGRSGINENTVPLRSDEDFQNKRRKLIQKLFHLSRPQRYIKLSPFGGLMMPINEYQGNNVNVEKGPAQVPVTPTTGGNLSPTGSTWSFPPPYNEAVQTAMIQMMGPEQKFKSETSAPVSVMKPNEEKK